MTLLRVGPTGLEAARCRSCGSWIITGRPCPTCDPATAQAFASHRWTRDIDPDCPTCAECSAKVWHADAWTICEAWLE